MTALKLMQNEQCLHKMQTPKSHKLLFLAKPFPPSRAPACTRTWNIAKYLTRLGWEVTVVTPHPSVWRQIDDPDVVSSKLRQEGIKRILTQHRWRFLLPRSLNCWNSGVGWFLGALCRGFAAKIGIDSNIGWIQEAEKECRRFSKGDVDVILATGSPFASFSLAKRLSDRLGCPYVMDYRDPWTQNPHRLGSPRRKELEEESRLIASSAAVTIVSPSWAKALGRRHDIGSKLHVVSNGYDPEDMAGIEPYDFGHFAIVYAGTFYPPKRVISPIMAALKALMENRENEREWFFHYYGPHEKHVLNEADRFGVSSKVIAHGWVPRDFALAAIRGAGLVVVITSVSDDASMEDMGIMTGKVYEALGLKTPVLLVTPTGSDLDMITKGIPGIMSFSGGNVVGISDHIKNLMLGSTRNCEKTESFSWPHIAKELDAVLRKAIRETSSKNL
jgi:glycosyltransferase involved in cell wall biosynthesis